MGHTREICISIAFLLLSNFIISLHGVHITPLQNQLLSSSIIDDCCCDVDTLKNSNTVEINPLLNEIVQQRFFKFFKLDLYTDCPFWVSQAVCGLGGCAICECSEDEIPPVWKQQKTDLVDTSTPKNFLQWEDVKDEMWTAITKETEMVYVNLQKYPEANTGYGKDGAMVWNRIYSENCFTGEISSMCLEERVFFRLISGLHTSINTHVCRNWKYDESNHKWIPNVELFEKTVKKFPERIQNLYFAYIFLLRAVNKAAPYLEQYTYDTGDVKEVETVKTLIKRLLSVDLLCHPNFDESILFSDPEKEQLRQQVKQHFRNISLIMNCVSCEKCKVYAKLQTLGLGTALKILLEPDPQVINHLQRNEIIALINTLRQISNSVEYVSYLSKLSDEGVAGSELSGTASVPFEASFEPKPATSVF